METKRTKEQLWHSMKSGLVIPAGIASNLSESSSQTYLHIKEKAKDVEQLYHSNNIPLPAGCALARLVNDAKTFSDAWFMDNKAVANWQLLFRVACFDRIADAILPLVTVPDRAKYLTVLTSGSLDLQQRDQSKAKDILWEIELWSTLRKRGIIATLHEPDLVVHFKNATIGIACKKVYSENNIAKVLSEGVEQIEATHDFGILAVNIDDLIPADQILNATTQESMGQMIEQMNQTFFNNHIRHFVRYLNPGRVIAALVSTSLLAELSSHKPSLIIGSQITIRAVPGLPMEKSRQLQRFYSQLMEQ
jgi:hypothetical protein